MLYLSHKAVHSEFVPADQHKDRYKSKSIRRSQDHGSRQSSRQPHVAAQSAQ
jgi:hypothetical protein